MSRLSLIALLAAVLVTAAGAVPSTPEARDPVWSRDGTRLAFVRSERSTGRIFVVSFTGSDLRAVTPRQPFPYGISWSPDGRSLAYASGGDIWRVDLATREPTRLTVSPELRAMQPAWSSDGRTIAYAVFEGCFRCTRIYAIDSDGGNPRLLATDGRRPAWSRDGALLLTSAPVTLVDVATGQARQIAEGFYASWSLDRTEFAFSGAGGLYASTPTRVLPELVWHTRRIVGYPAISPHHNRIALVRGKRVQVLLRATGAQVTLSRSSSANDAPAWSFRGALAFVADGRCGPRSEIDVVRSDSSRRRALVRVCS